MKAAETIGTMTPDSLVIDGKHDLDVMGATITVGAGETIKRGAPLSLTSGGKFIQLTADQLKSSSLQVSDMPVAINCDDISNSTESSADIYGSVYKSGNFNRNLIEEIADAPLTRAIQERLREVGIFTENVEG